METPISSKLFLDTIQQLKSEMLSHFDVKMDCIQQSLSTLQSSLSTLGEHVSELEQRVSTNEDNILDYDKRMKSLESDNSYLREKLEDVENRSRAYNLRFVHVPENSEGKDIHGFMGELIQLLLGHENFPTPPVIERAHRSPILQSKKQKAGRPRPIMVKLLSLQDRRKILRVAREKKELEFNGGRVYIFPDFSAGLLTKRRQFDNVKKKLRDLQMDYSLIYPATLRIISNSKPVLFKCPEEVESFLQDINVTNVDMKDW